ncbi:hypothetical protein V6R21_09000 [Limibacter armeniacum]|uniref:hypothetical protein n=1 Tax=Limibacter armeniacum TaxID=466084 RepID=UPI002FE64278
MEEKLIKTTPLKGIRSVRFTEGENVRRYEQLKRTIGQDDAGDYRLFARPVVAEAGRDAIDWYTTFEGPFQPLTSFSEDEQEKLKQVFKRKANNLYRRCLRLMRSGNGQLSEQYKQLFQMLDTSLEIPDYSDIYVCGPVEGPEFALIRWGFVLDEHNAERGILRKLIPLGVTSMYIKVRYKDGSSAAGERMQFAFEGQTVTKYVGEGGALLLEDVPFFTKVQYMQNGLGGETYNAGTLFSDEQTEYEIILDKVTEPMRFQVQYPDGTTVANEEVEFFYDGKSWLKVSDPSGNITLPEIRPFAKITAKNKDGQSFQYEHTSRSLHLIQVEKPIIVVPPIETPIEIPVVEVPAGNMNVYWLWKKNRKPLVNQDVKIAVSGLAADKLRTDEIGRTIMPEVAYGSNVKAWWAKQSEKKAHSFVYLPETDRYEILVSKRPMWWLWLIPLLLIGLALWLWWWLNAGLTVAVQDIAKHIPLQDAEVTLVTKDKILSKLTEEDGEVFFEREEVEGLQGDTLKLLVNRKKYKHKEAVFVMENRKEFKLVELEAIDPPALNIIVIDKATGKRLHGVDIELKLSNGSQYKDITEDRGEVLFEELPISDNNNAEISLKKEGYYPIEKPVQLEDGQILEVSLEMEEEVRVLPCDTSQSSGGMGTTYNTFQLPTIEGTFRIAYDMQNVPDQLDIYEGTEDEVRAGTARLIWSTHQPVSGKDDVSIPYQLDRENKNHYVTLRIMGEQNGTLWRYTFFCSDENAK